MPHKDPKKRAQYQQRYRQQHSTSLGEYARRYYKKHRAHKIVVAKRWRLKNLLRYNQLARVAARKRRSLQLEKLLTKQKNLCGLCGHPFTKKNPPVRDHCHKSGRWRSLLHNGCNIAIGHLHDSPELCLKAANYLRRWMNLLKQLQKPRATI